MNTKDFFNDVKQYSKTFWLLNILQMVEKLAYWIVLLQLPIYIAQKDAPGGLHWDQAIKGVIFFWWAIVQNLSPIFLGGYIDRYGYKKSLLIAFIIAVMAYLLMGVSRDYWSFFVAVILLGLGLATFKPALQGAVATTLKGKNTSLGWGIYFMLMNLAVFIGPPLSKYLREISWEAVFFGSALLFSINFIVLGFLPKSKVLANSFEKPLLILKNIFSTLFRDGLYKLIFLMSGFAIVYIQFYETLPNFIYDWIDTSSIVQNFKLPDYMTMDTALGKMVSYEWMYNLNAGFIIIGVVFVSWLFLRVNPLKTLLVGIIISTLGLLLSGATMNGYFTIAGMLIYTLGEMMCNPKFTEYLGNIAPVGKKAQYLSYLNISFAIGFGSGALLGGWLYQNYGEKAGFALDYLKANNLIETNVKLTDAFFTLTQKLNLSPLETTKLLWDTYDPYLVWLPVVVIGAISAIGMFILGKKRVETN